MLEEPVLIVRSWRGCRLVVAISRRFPARTSLRDAPYRIVRIVSQSVPAIDQEHVSVCALVRGRSWSRHGPVGADDPLVPEPLPLAPDDPMAPDALPPVLGTAVGTGATTCGMGSGGE